MIGSFNQSGDGILVGGKTIIIMISTKLQLNPLNERVRDLITTQDEPTSHYSVQNSFGTNRIWRAEHEVHIYAYAM